MLTKEFAQAHLGNVAHKSRSDIPVIFFGTSEIAWIGVRDVIQWGDGMQQQLHHKGKKNKKFVIALEQVCTAHAPFHDNVQLARDKLWATFTWHMMPPALALAYAYFTCLHAVVR